MIPSLQFLRERFDYFNSLCFGGHLAVPPLGLNTRRAALGITRYRTRTLSDGTREHIDIAIELSTRHDLSAEEWDDVVVHEMIHYYILSSGIADTGKHGRVFRAKMAELNEAHGLHITVKHDPTAEELMSMTRRLHYVCVADTDDGRVALAVAAKTRLFQLWDELPRIGSLSNFRWYASRRKYFDTIRTTLTPKMIVIGREEAERYLEGAVRLARRGMMIGPER